MFSLDTLRHYSGTIAGGLLFMITLVIFWLSPVHQVTDSHYSMLLSQGLLENRSFALESYSIPRLTPEYHDHTWKNGHIHQLELVGNHFYYYMPPGSSVLSVPYVALANSLGVSARNADGSYNPDGERKIETSLAALLMAGLAVVFFISARLMLPLNWSLVISIGAVLGTQIWSTASRALWADTWGIFLLGIVVYLLLADEAGRRKLNPILLATLLSWMYFVRPTYSVLIIAVTGYVIWAHRDLFVRYALTGGLWFALFATYSWVHYQSLLPTYFRINRRINLEHFGTAIIGNLISPSRGLVLYVPVLLFAGFIAVRYRSAFSASKLPILAWTSIVLLLLVVSTFDPWWAGASFGPRYLTPVVPWFVLLAIFGMEGLLNSWSDSSFRKRGILAVGALLLLVSIFINAIGALSHKAWLWNAHGDIDHDPRKVWDLKYPQLLAAFMHPPLPATFPPMQARVELSAPEAEKYLGFGWSGAEAGFRWTDGDEAAIIFAANQSEDISLSFSSTPFLVPGKHELQRVTILLNYHPIKSLELRANRPELLQLDLPGGFVTQKNVLVFRLPDAAAPSDFGINADERRLALAVQWIGFSSANTPAR